MHVRGPRHFIPFGFDNAGDGLCRHAGHSCADQLGYCGTSACRFNSPESEPRSRWRVHSYWKNGNLPLRLPYPFLPCKTLPLHERLDVFEELPLEYFLVEFRGIPPDVVRAPAEGFEIFDRGVERFRGLFREKRSGEAFFHRFERSALAVGDNGRSAGHCFERHDAEIFFRRENERLRLLVQSDLFVVPRADYPFDIGFGFLEKFLEKGIFGSGGDYEPFSVGVEGVDEEVEFLIRNGAAHGEVVIVFFGFHHEFFRIDSGRYHR